MPGQLVQGLDVSALILGAGSGVRMGQGPKAFMQLQAQTLLERAILAVEPYCAEIVAGVREADLPLAEELVDGLGLATRVILVPGGCERQETVTRLVENASCPLVLLHEVARPFARGDSFAAVLAAARQFGAAALYTELRVRDGLALMRNGAFAAPLPRASCRAADAACLSSHDAARCPYAGPAIWPPRGQHRGARAVGRLRGALAARLRRQHQDYLS